MKYKVRRRRTAICEFGMTSEVRFVEDKVYTLPFKAVRDSMIGSGMPWWWPIDFAVTVRGGYIYVTGYALAPKDKGLKRLGVRSICQAQNVIRGSHRAKGR